MIHHLYVGHFEKEGPVLKLAKRQADGPPRPVVTRPLDPATVRELLEQKGVEGTSVPPDWRLGIEEDGFIICDAYPQSRDAIDFIRRLAQKTGCDVLYDGTVAFSPDELAFAADQAQRAV